MAKQKLQEEEMISVSTQEFASFIEKVAKRVVAEQSTATVQGEGDPGIGKSQIVKEVAIKAGMNFVDIRLGQFSDPESMIMKLPTPDHKELTQIILADFPKTPNNVLLLDEFRHADQSVRRAAYQLLLERKLGPYVVPPGTVIVALTNDTIDANTEEIEGPLFDRFDYRMKIVTDFEKWQDYISAKEYPYGPIVQSFLKYNKDSFFLRPEHGRVLMTPRRWEKVCKDMPDMQMVEKIMPPGTYILFEQFHKKVEMFRDVDQYIQGNKRCPEDIGDQYAIQAAVMSILANETRNFDDKIFEVFEDKFANMDPDVRSSTILGAIRMYQSKKKSDLVSLVAKMPANKKPIFVKIMQKYGFVAQGAQQTM